MTATSALRRIYEADADKAAALELLLQSVMGEDVDVPVGQVPGLTAGLLAVAAEILGRQFHDAGTDGVTAARKWLEWRIRQEHQERPQ